MEDGDEKDDGSQPVDTKRSSDAGSDPGSDPASGPFEPGAEVAGRWTVVREIGRGSSGTVYLARDRETGGKDVALKVIHRERCGDPQVFGRFRREAKILEKLDARHVVPILECTSHDGLVILALELAGGASLETLLAEHKTGLPALLAVEIARQLGEALAAAHEAGIVHRDLKPANVVIEEVDGGKLVRILDFGLAKAIATEHQMTAITDKGMIFGTPEYMAPEQVRGDESDGRGDVYALGIVLYEMLSGRVPFQERTAIATMTAHLGQSVPPLRERSSSSPPKSGAASSSARSNEPVSGALEAVVMRALAKEPGDRWPSARAFVEALVAAQDERRVVTRASADAVPLGETIPADGAGALRRSQVLRAAAEHARRAPAPPSSRPTLPSAGPPGTSPPPAPLVEAPKRDEPAQGGRGLWIALGIVLALLCVGAGAMFGAR